MLGIYVCSISLILKHISKYLDLLFENYLLLKVSQLFGENSCDFIPGEGFTPKGKF